MKRELDERTELTEEDARYHIEQMVKYLTKETDPEVISSYSDTFELILELRIINAIKEIKPQS